MNQFHPELFTLGPCEERIFKTPVTKLAVLDDFWSDFEAVQEQLEILAYAHTAYSDTDMEDFRFGWDKFLIFQDSVSIRNYLLSLLSTAIAFYLTVLKMISTILILMLVAFLLLCL